MVKNDILQIDENTQIISETKEKKSTKEIANIRKELKDNLSKTALLEKKDKIITKNITLEEQIAQAELIIKRVNKELNLSKSDIHKIINPNDELNISTNNKLSSKRSINLNKDILELKNQMLENKTNLKKLYERKSL
jgi:hypothetical protein